MNKKINVDEMLNGFLSEIERVSGTFESRNKEFLDKFWGNMDDLGLPKLRLNIDSHPFQNIDKEVNEGVNPDGTKYVETKWTSPDGLSFGITKTTWTEGKSDGNENSTRGLPLESELKEAVANEDYELAVKLKKKLDIAKKNESKITELRSAIDEAVKVEDYTKAAELKKEMDSLK